ncbi:hypothetical protein FB451DRAFT_1041286, partial [Mycena latifolia]
MTVIETYTYLLLQSPSKSSREAETGERDRLSCRLPHPWSFQPSKTSLRAPTRSYSPALRLLYTNDPRVDHQVAEITNSLDIARTLKSSLSDQITEIRMNLMRLEREELHASRHIERCVFALAPVRRVPLEILAHIFLCYTNLLGKVESVEVKNGVWILGHICSYWRAVALSTPDLWTSFRSLSPSHEGAPPLVQAWLDRAGNRPLSI